MNEWMTYALRADTTKWMMSTFWYPRVLVNTCDRLHEILIPFPFSESFTIAMCLCCLSFLIPISELIMSYLAMGMLLSILWWEFEQCLHCLIFFSSTSVTRTCPGWLAYSWRPAGQNSAAAVKSTCSLFLSRGSRHLTAHLWVGRMLIIVVAETSSWLARLTQMPLRHEQGIFTAKLSSVGL